MAVDVLGDGASDYVVRVVSGKASQHMEKLTGLDCPGGQPTQVSARWRDGTVAIGCELDPSIPTGDILKTF